MGARKLHPLPQLVTDRNMGVRRRGRGETMCTSVGRCPGACTQAWGMGVPRCVLFGADERAPHRGYAESARV